MSFTALHKVPFAACDPAGLVFFPQYLVMLNTLVERWFDEDLGVSYSGLISQRHLGLPTVRLEVDFTAISRHGDALTQHLRLVQLGRSSMTVQATFSGGEELRLRARQVLVCTDLANHRPVPLPADLRAALEPHLEKPE